MYCAEVIAFSKTLLLGGYFTFLYWIIFVYFLFVCCGSQDTSVSIVIRPQGGRLENQDLIPSRSSDFSLLQIIQTVSVVHSASYAMCKVVKWPGCKDDHWPSSSPEVKDVWCCLHFFVHYWLNTVISIVLLPLKCTHLSGGCSIPMSDFGWYLALSEIFFQLCE
jgi:hypothetical protein